MANPDLSAGGTDPGGAYVQPSPGVVLQAVTQADWRGNLVRTADAGISDGTSFLGGAVALIALPSAAYSSTVPPSCTVSTAGITYAALDMTLTSFQGGTSPTISFFLERAGADGNWYQILSTSALSTPQQISVDISPGLNGTASGPLSSTVQHNVFSQSARLRWAFGGSASPATVTFSASLVGR